MGRRIQNTDVPFKEISIFFILFIGLALMSPKFKEKVTEFSNTGLVVIAIGIIVLTICLLIKKVLLSETNKSVVGVNKNYNKMNYDLKNSDPKTESSNNTNFSDDIIKQLCELDWFQFEKLMAILYRKYGYTVHHIGGANPDGGIDLIIEKHGVKSAVQCKHWKTWNVGVKTVREFLGALTHSGIKNGVIIALGGFTNEAKELASNHNIQFLSGFDLKSMIKNTDIRFDPEALEILKDKKKYCPKCGSVMVLRTSSKVINSSSQFWGCSAFPKCKFTMPFEENSHITQ